MPSSGGNERRHEVMTGSRVAFDGKLIRVRVDDVRLPSGRESVREVVEHRGAVAILPLTADGRVIFVRQYRYAVGRTLLELPAGTREPDEDPAATARRELMEETGFTSERLTELATYYSSAGFSTEQITLFRADDCVPAPRELLPDEPAQPVLIPVTEIGRLLEPGPDRVVAATSLVGLLWLLSDL